MAGATVKLDRAPWARFALVLLASTLCGCEFLGPRALRAGRGQYNTALQQTEMEELLLNLVRLRYGDNPYFLQVTSITTSPEVNVGIGGTEKEGAEGGLSYTERPNIIYTPLTGEGFVRQLLTPIDLNTIELLVGAGWEIDDVMRIFVNEINGVSNAVTSVGPSPDRVPSFEEFLAVVEAFDSLDDSRLVSLASVPDGDEIVMLVPHEARETEAFQLITEHLSLDPGAPRYRFRLGLAVGGGDTIYIQTRPIAGALFYLGNSIQIPDEVMRDGSAHTLRTAEGEPYDWGPLYSGLVAIRSAGSRPRSSYLSVRYGDHWYYVEASDVETREVLTMVKMVFTLQAGGVPSSGPLLTLPVLGG